MRDAMSASIQTRVLALVGLLVFIAGGLLSVLSRSSFLALEEEVLEDHQRLAGVLSTSVAAALDGELQLLAGAAGAPHVNLGDGNNQPERAALDGVVHRGKLTSAVAFLDRAGEVVACAAAEGVEAFATPAASHAAIRAISEQRPLVSDVIRTAGERSAIMLLVPFHPLDGSAEGAVAAAIHVPSRGLEELLEGLAAGADVRLQLIDGTGVELASSGPVPPPRALSGVAQVGRTSWRLAVTDTGPDPLAPVAAFRRQSLWLAPSLAAIAMLLGWGIGTSVRRPLTRLTDSAERIARGELDHVLESGASKGGDEVARLTSALENMRASLKRSIDEIARANQELEQRVADRTRELAAVNARLEDRERLRAQLLRKVISAQEDERRRVARELHDETSQTLAALGMGVDAELARCTDPPAKAHLAELRALVDRMHQELGRLIVNLRPSVLDDLGLGAAIHWLAERHLSAAGIAVRCELKDLDLRLTSEAETAVFRAVQEAIANIVRHAHAESVLIQGSVERGHLTIEIEDDGEGFDPETAVGTHGSLRGIGLLGMQERMEILGGTLTLESEPGAGTRVVMTIPTAGQSL